MQDKACSSDSSSPPPHSMHALSSLQREYETTAGTNKFDPLPWTWKMPRPAFLVSRTFTTLAPFTPSNTQMICARKPKNPWPRTVSNRTIILTASTPNPKRNPAKNLSSRRLPLFWPLIASAHEPPSENPVRARRSRSLARKQAAIRLFQS